jgi:hypothetical protein
MLFDIDNLNNILIDFLGKNSIQNKLLNNNNNQFNEEFEDLIINCNNELFMEPKYEDNFLTDENVKYIKNHPGASGFVYSDNLYIFNMYHSKNKKIYIIWFSKQNDDKGVYLL